MAKNNRGVTPIISVILLLMMTVGVSSLAWVWLQSVTGGIMDTTRNMTDKQLQQMLTSMDIADYGVECNSTIVQNVTLLVFNRGSTTVDLRAVLVEGTKVADGDLMHPDALPPGAMDGIKISNAQRYFRGLNRTSSGSGKVLLSAGQGYITKTMEIRSERCH